MSEIESFRYPLQKIPGQREIGYLVIERDEAVVVLDSPLATVINHDSIATVGTTLW